MSRIIFPKFYRVFHFLSPESKVTAGVAPLPPAVFSPRARRTYADEPRQMCVDDHIILLFVIHARPPCM